MSDCQTVLAYLKNHSGWHNAVDMMRDLKPGAVNWALRSRVSDLRKKGHEIEMRIGKNGCAEYRLKTFIDAVQFDSFGQGTFA